MELRRNISIVIWLMILPARFYRRDTVTVAREILGCFLVHDSKEGRTVGRIVETEAYLASGDPACHAARGKTERNAAMFLGGGFSYVYLIYGMYYCFNVVSGKRDMGEAVLIRALEPIEGVELMKQRRQKTRIKDLCSGPGKLAQAMAIDRSLNAQKLYQGNLQILSGDSYPELFQAKKPSIVRTTRIGINAGANLQLRFYLKDSPYVSRR